MEMNLVHYGRKEVEDTIEGIDEPQFNEKLTLEDMDKETWDRAVKEAEKRSGKKSQKFHYSRHAVTMTHREKAPQKDKYPAWFKDLQPLLARMCGCYDYIEYVGLVDYLRINGNRFLIPVRLICHVDYLTMSNK